MAKITIPIVNGTGTSNVSNGNYTVTATATGYDASSINPASINVQEGVNAYAFTIAATGTLTIHVTDTGTSEGTPIVGATLIRTDSEGTEYGTPIVTDNTGNAVFTNVPFAATEAPTIYFKQTASDGQHDFSTTVISTTMTEDTATYELANPLSASRTFTMTDANYTNLPIESLSINLE